MSLRRAVPLDGAMSGPDTELLEPEAAGSVRLRDEPVAGQATDAAQVMASIVEWSEDAIIGNDLRGIITSWNDGAARLYGYAAEEALGRHVSLIIPPERVLEWELFLWKIRQGEGAIRHETVRIRRDGTPINVSVTLSPIKDDCDRRVGASAIARDITERTRAETALRESEERFRRIFAEAPVGQAVAELDGRFIQVNRAFSTMFGYTMEELLELSWHALAIHEEVESQEELQKALVSGESEHLHVERLGRRKDGTTLDVMVSISLIRHEDGEPRYFDALVQDITERKRVENALREETVRQELLIRLSRRSLTSVDVDALLDETLTMIAQALDVEATGVHQLLHNRDDLVPLAGTGWKGGVVGKLRFPQGSSSLSGFTLTSGRPVLVEDLRHEQRFAVDPELTANGILSCAAVIMCGQDSPFGVLMVHCTRPRSFTEDEVAFLQGAADILAHSLQRREAEEELQRSFEILRHTNR